MGDEMKRLRKVLALVRVSIRMSQVARQLSIVGLLACLIVGRPARAQDSAVRSELGKQSEARFLLLSDSEAWQRLPEAEEGGGSPLPVWAKGLASALPRTTAAMLELDWLHRAMSPLDPKLRGMMRCVIARANQCEYTVAYAVADLVRAGLDERELHALSDDVSQFPEAEKSALMFAREMTQAASTVTDAEVARLVEFYGEKQVVAMVLLVAYANFQDRLILALGLPMEPGGPLPPVRVRFARGISTKPIAAPPRELPAKAPQDKALDMIADADWLAASFETLQNNLETQRSRQPRIRVPSWDEVREHLPPGPARDKPLRIKWSLVCIGYQPELANAWSACTRAFREDAQQDRVFEESLFWVITRTIDCFY